MGKPIKPGEELTIDEALGREICQRENLRALFEAGLTRTGKEYLLTGRLLDPKTGVAVRSYSARIYSEDQILDSLDKVAQNVRRDLGETLYSVRRDNRPLPQVTTASLTALQLYAESNDLWTKGKYLDANKQLLEAVRVDPDFAMAHAALGNQYFSHIFTKPDDGRAEYERALRLSNRITERERLFIEASFAGYRTLYNDAIHLYNTYLDLYPDDAHVRFNLANLFMRLNRCPDAMAQYHELLRINPADVNAEINLATCCANQRKFAEALPHYRRAFELSPDRLTSANINREYGFSLAAAGEPEKAREVFGLALNKPESRSQALRSLGLLDLYEGRYEDAIAQLQGAVAANETEKNDLGVARNRLYLAIAHLGRGDASSALAELDQASRFDALFTQAPWIAARIGTLYVRAGNPDAAAHVLERIKAEMKSDDTEAQSESRRLEGELLVARGDFAKGILLLQNARVETYPPSIPLTLEGLAHAYVKASQPEKAIPLYESLIEGDSGNPLAWEAQQSWIEARYQLAALDAARGNPARAIQLLDSLLAIWKHADPNLPLFLQAKSLRESLNR
jgi:tetratricopeptide (TPR) repeat protein